MKYFGHIKCHEGLKKRIKEGYIPDQKGDRFRNHRRFANNRIPKQIFFGELSEGKRTRSRPKLRFKDLCKASLTDFRIKPDFWVEMASDRDMWRTAMRKGEAEFKKALITKIEDKRQRRKMPASHRPDLPCSYCDRSCHSAIGRVSHERACLTQLDEMISTNP
jgi:hypothetical protein